MARNISHILFFWILCISAGNAAATPFSKDSVFYKDTSIESKSIRQSRPEKFGLGINYGWNFYKDGVLPDQLAQPCELFTTGKGSQLNFLGRVDFPIGSDNDNFTLSPVISFENFGADHTWAEFVPVRPDNVIRLAEYDHVITDNTRAIGIKALFGWKFLQPFFFEAGPALYYLYDRQATKFVKAITPGDLVRTDSGNAREAIEGSGTLPNAKSFMAALSFSLGAEISLSKISKQLSATPALEFLLPITQTTDYWTNTSFRIGLTFRYELDSHNDTIIENHTEKIPVHIEIPEEKKPNLSASIDAVVVNRDGKQEHVVRLEVEEVKVHYAYPMLNYIFFDEGSPLIPYRYKRYSSFSDVQKNFNPSLDQNGISLMQLYYETLNIMGDRLRKSSNMRITITGCTSNTGIESGNIDLAHRRAETVKDYFEKIWQIDPKRMTIESRLLPEKPSPSNIPEGEEENRRVEITSNDISFTDPLIVPRTEHIANPPNISLVPHIRSDTGIKSYRSSISIGGKELVSFNGSELKPWSIPEEALSSGVDSLDIFLNVTDSAGNVVTAKNSIKLEQKHVEREQQQELEKFSLILFAFDESTLGTKNERTLGLVAESFQKTKPKSLSIVGYTDELGDANHNDELSRRRAAEASTELQHALQSRGLKLPQNFLIDGKGSREKLYDNSLPEGRFFSRTVNITLEHGK